MLREASYSEIYIACGYTDLRKGIDGLAAWIQNIYHTDNALKKLPPSDRKKKRKKLVKPLVDEFFDWAGKAQYAAAGSDKTKKKASN